MIKDIALWNWLTTSGRDIEAVEIMNPSNDILRKTLYAEYESTVQKNSDIYSGKRKTDRKNIVVLNL